MTRLAFTRQLLATESGKLLLVGLGLGVFIVALGMNWTDTIVRLAMMIVAAGIVGTCLHKLIFDNWLASWRSQVQARPLQALVTGVSILVAAIFVGLCSAIAWFGPYKFDMLTIGLLAGIPQLLLGGARAMVRRHYDKQAAERS